MLTGLFIHLATGKDSGDDSTCTSTMPSIVRHTTKADTHTTRYTVDGTARDVLKSLRRKADLPDRVQFVRVLSDWWYVW